MRVRGERSPRRISDGPPIEVPPDPELELRCTCLEAAHRLRAQSPAAPDPIGAAGAFVAWIQSGRSPAERQARQAAVELVSAYRVRVDLNVEGFLEVAGELATYLAGGEGRS